MKDLKCGLSECIYNRNFCCNAKKIQVGETTDCESFEPSSERRSALFELGEDFATRDYTVDTFVECAADCLFNKGNVCSANGITVSGSYDGDAACMSFIKD